VRIDIALWVCLLRQVWKKLNTEISDSSQRLLTIAMSEIHMTSEVDDEEFQTLADPMDMDTLREDYFEGGVFFLLDRTYTIDTDGEGKYRVHEGKEQVLTDADFSEVRSLLRN
jgi:hypothetical protein